MERWQLCIRASWKLAVLWCATQSGIIEPCETVMLHIVCCHFNPAGYQRPREHVRRFRDALGLPFTMVEASFDGVFYADPDIAIVADPKRHVMWQKERLLNLGLATLPRTAEKIAWIDADILFDNPDWANEAVALLEDWPVVQLFETVSMLNSSGEVESEHLGKVAGLAHGRQVHHCRPLKTGFAWAARREAIGLDALLDRPVSSHARRGGLFDLDIVGGGDSSMISAWLGRNNDWLVRHMNREFLTAYRPWAVDAQAARPRSTRIRAGPDPASVPRLTTSTAVRFAHRSTEGIPLYTPRGHPHRLQRTLGVVVRQAGHARSREAVL